MLLTHHESGKDKNKKRDNANSGHKKKHQARSNDGQKGARNGGRNNDRNNDRKSDRNNDRNNGKNRNNRNKKHKNKRRRAYDIVCNACNIETTVPFKPSPGKPVFCQECYKKNKSNPVPATESVNPEKVETPPVVEASTASEE